MHCRQNAGSKLPPEAVRQWSWRNVDIVFIDHLPDHLQPAAKRAPAWTLHPPWWALEGRVKLRGLLQRTLSVWPGPADSLKVYHFHNVSRCTSAYDGDPLAGVRNPAGCASEREMGLGFEEDAIKQPSAIQTSRGPGLGICALSSFDGRGNAVTGALRRGALRHAHRS